MSTGSTVQQQGKKKRAEGCPGRPYEGEHDELAPAESGVTT